MDNTRVRPGRWMYWLSAGIMAFSVLFTAPWLIYWIARVAEFDAQFQRCVMPGTSSITINEPGEYTVYHEYSTAYAGRSYRNAEDLGDMQLSVKVKSSGQAVTVTKVKNEENYSSGKTQGVGMWKFEAASPGEYEMTAAYESGNAKPEVVLSVAKDVVKKLVTAILAMTGGLFAGIGIFCVGALLLVATLIIRAVSRSRAAGA
jgi:hypothetical protein